MNMLNRLLTAVFQDRWGNWSMTGGAILLGIMLVVPDGSPTELIASWVAIILLVFALLRSLYVGWNVCRGKALAEESVEVVHRREQIGNYVFAAVFGLMLVLALCKLIC